MKLLNCKLQSLQVIVLVIIYSAHYCRSADTISPSPVDDIAPKDEITPQPNVTSHTNHKYNDEPIKRSDTTSNRRILSPPEDQSFFSKLSNWFFPSRSKKSDSYPEGTGPIPQYRAPPQHYQQEECNPCNEVPWVPIHSASPPKKITLEFHQKPPLENYAPIETHQVNDFNHKDQGVYGPPQDTYGPPKDSYGPPKETYGPPQNQIENLRPHPDTYGPPKPIQIESTGGAIISGGSSGVSIPLKYTYTAPKLNQQHPNIIYGAPNIGAPPATPLRQPSHLKFQSFKANTQQLPPLYKYGPPFNSGSQILKPAGYNIPPKISFSSGSSSYSPSAIPAFSYAPSSTFSLSTSHLGSSGSHSSSFGSNTGSHSIITSGNSNNGLYGLPISSSSGSSHSILSSGGSNPPKVTYGSPLSLPTGSSSSNNGAQIIQSSGVISAPLISYGPPLALTSGPSSNSHSSSGSLVSYGPPLSSSSSSSHSIINTGSSTNSLGGNTVLSIKPSGLPENSYSPTNQADLYAPQYSGYLGPPPVKSLHRPTKSASSHFGIGYKYGGSGANYKFPPRPHYSIPPSQKQIFGTHSISSSVTPTSNEYIPPPQQLPIAPSNHPQNEIIQETSIVHIPVYENQLILTSGIPFPELTRHPIPPIHQAKPFYDQKVKQIEIHESENGNLQYLTNIPNVDHSGGTQGGHGVKHNQELIRDVISNIPEKIPAPIGAEVVPKHIDTTHSETKVENVNSILVPPPPPSFGQSPPLKGHFVKDENFGHPPPPVQAQLVHHQSFGQQAAASQNFQQTTNFLGDNQYTEVKVVQSIPIAEFTSSIEYPISIQQASITDVVASKDVEDHHHEDESLSSNPIIVAQDSNFDDLSAADIDSHIAEASSLNITIKDTRNKEARNTKEATLTSIQNSTDFAAPNLDFSSWYPSVDEIPTSILPPSVKAQDGWAYPKMPTKQIQIIIPYTSNNYPAPFGNTNSGNTNWIQEQNLFLNGQSKLPNHMDPKIFMTPPPMDNSQLLWLKNIRNEVPDNAISSSFDILRLQKNIDKWTAQEFAPHITETVVTTGQLVPSKKIPSEYLTTTALSNDIAQPTELPLVGNFNDALDDYEVGASIRHSVHINLPENHKNSTKVTVTTKVPEETTTYPTTETTYQDTTWETTTADYEDEFVTTPSWNQAQVSISPLTREKVYVVTPQPWNHDEPTPASAWNLSPDYSRNDNGRRLVLNNDNLQFASPRFISRPSPVSPTSTTTEETLENKNNFKIIYSEWPQSINNLETTTTSNASGAKPSKSSLLKKQDKKQKGSGVYKALWGLMDITPYTPPSVGVVETHSGHSKVVSVATPSSISRSTSNDEIS